MKKRGKFIAIGLLILLLVLAGIVFFGWKLGKGPLAYLKYDTFHLGEVVYVITEWSKQDRRNALSPGGAGGAAGDRDPGPRSERDCGGQSDLCQDAGGGGDRCVRF